MKVFACTKCCTLLTFASRKDFVMSRMLHFTYSRVALRFWRVSLPVATNNVSGLESLKTIAFSTCFNMWLGSFSASNQHSGIALGSLRDHAWVASDFNKQCGGFRVSENQSFFSMFHNVAGKFFSIE